MELTKPLHPEDAPQEARNAHEEERRQRILTAADEQFRLYGYSKTTMADLSRAIGVSAGYIYIFFKSKQAVGEAICERCLKKIIDEVEQIANEPGPASERLRRVYEELARQSKKLFFEERKLHDIVRVAITEKWSNVPRYEAQLRSVMRRLVIDGRDSGEFDRKTPPDEICRAIMQTLLPFVHPVLLEEKLDELEQNAASVAGLVLRSLSS